MSLRYEVRPWLSSGTFLEVLKRLSTSPDEVANTTIEVDVYTAGYWNIPTTAHFALIDGVLIPDVKPGESRYNRFRRHSTITTEKK